MVQMTLNLLILYLTMMTKIKMYLIMANMNMQAQLEPEHPASIFGQSVREGPTPYEIEAARNARMQALSAAYNLAQAINSTSQDRLRVEAQKAIDDVLLPPGDTTDQYVDAAAILSLSNRNLSKWNHKSFQPSTDSQTTIDRFFRR